MSVRSRRLPRFPVAGSREIARAEPDAEFDPEKPRRRRTGFFNDQFLPSDGIIDGAHDPMSERPDDIAHPMAPVAVTLPDGSRRAFPGPVSGAEIAAAIGPGLAKAAIAVTVDGRPRDLTTLIDH